MGKETPTQEWGSRNWGGCKTYANTTSRGQRMVNASLERSSSGNSVPIRERPPTCMDQISKYRIKPSYHDEEPYPPRNNRRKKPDEEEDMYLVEEKRRRFGDSDRRTTPHYGQRNDRRNNGFSLNRKNFSSSSPRKLLSHSPKKNFPYSQSRTYQHKAARRLLDDNFDKENRHAVDRSPRIQAGADHGDEINSTPVQSRKSNPFREKDDETASRNEKVLSTNNYPSCFPNDQAQCYRNAALQALLSLEPFVQDLCLVQKLSSSAPTPVSEDSAEESVAVDEHVLTELVNVFLSRENRDRPKLESALKRLNDCVKRKARGQFQVDSMNDANEYINLLLESVSDLADKIKKPSGGSGSFSPAQSPPAPPNSPEPDSMECNPILSNFGLKTTDTLTCEKCGAVTVNQPSEHKELFLDFPDEEKESDIGSLKQYFANYFKPEIRERKCTVAGCEGTHANFKHQISQLPRVLILNLKRYKFSDSTAKKIEKEVKIPKHLSVAEMVSEKESVLPPNWQRLQLSPMKTVNGFVVLPSRGRTCEVNTPPGILRTPPGDGGSDADSGFSSVDEDSDLQKAISESMDDYQKSIEEAQLRSLDPSHQEPKAAPENAEPSTSSAGLIEEDDEGLVEDHASGLRYRLVGVISHLGWSLLSGHYTADVYKASEDTWYRFDDLSVVKRTEEQVLNDKNRSQGYMFFYMNENVLASARRVDALHGAMEITEPLSP